jgi:hypothetical protein
MTLQGDPPGDGVQHTVVRKSNGVSVIGTAGLDKGIPVVVYAMPIWQLILVRVARTYIAAFLSLWPVIGTGIVDVQLFGEAWNAIGSAALVALAPTLFSLLQNAVEFLSAIDVNNPGWRA